LGAWNLLKNGADYAIKISDDYAKLAMRELYVPLGDDSQIISGESGAAGLAGFLTIMIEDEFKDVKATLGIDANTNILCINTEGDTDEAVFNAIINNEL
jgi:diaminopropionate ammonia-lyase